MKEKNQWFPKGNVLRQGSQDMCLHMRYLNITFLSVMYVMYVCMYVSTYITPWESFMPSAQIVDSGKAWKFFADYKKKDRKKILSTFHYLTGVLHGNFHPWETL